MTLRPSLRLLPLALIFGLAACGSTGRQPIESVATKAPAQSSLDAAMDALNQGDEAGARKQIKLLLKANPADPQALVLQESLDRDPVDLMGPKSFPYTVQPGDTMQSIAATLLGNKLKFYQLARYNGVKVPATLAAGTVLKIPGTPPKAEAPTPAPAKPRAAPAPRPKVAATPKAPAPQAAPAPAPKTNPVAAAQLRSAGLAALNQGKVANAVGLLRRAAALDPGNPLIGRDLARAERIARTVQEHR